MKRGHGGSEVVVTPTYHTRCESQVSWRLRARRIVAVAVAGAPGGPTPECNTLLKGTDDGIRPHAEGLAQGVLHVQALAPHEGTL